MQIYPPNRFLLSEAEILARSCMIDWNGVSLRKKYTTRQTLILQSLIIIIINHIKIVIICIKIFFSNISTQNPRASGNSEEWNLCKICYVQFQIFLRLFYKNLKFRLRTIYRILVCFV